MGKLNNPSGGDFQNFAVIVPSYGLCFHFEFLMSFLLSGAVILYTMENFDECGKLN